MLSVHLGSFIEKIRWEEHLKISKKYARNENLMAIWKSK